MTWCISTFVPTITLSSSSSASFFCLRLARFCLIVSVHRAISPFCGISSSITSECIERVGRCPPRLADPRVPRVGEKRPVSTSAESEDVLIGDEKSLEVRPVECLGTCNVWRCTSRGAVGCKDDFEAPAAFESDLGVYMGADFPSSARGVARLKAFDFGGCPEASVEIGFT